MILSELEDFSYCIHRNGEFNRIGSLYSNTHNRIVPITNIDELELLKTKKEITGVIITPELIDHVPLNFGIIVTKTPLIVSLEIHNSLEQNEYDSQFPTIIHKTAKIHPTADIDPHGVIIEYKSKIDAYVRIHKGVIIGKNVRIGSNTTIGSIPNPDNENPDTLSYLVHGKVIIEDKARIHANVTIERPYYSEETRIGQECHIDSQTKICQGTIISKSTLIAAIVTIGSYVMIGEGCWVGPRCSIKPGVKIGKSCHITLGSRVEKTISPEMIVKDNWAIKRERFKGFIP